MRLNKNHAAFFAIDFTSLNSNPAETLHHIRQLFTFRVHYLSRTRVSPRQYEERAIYITLSPIRYSVAVQLSLFLKVFT